MPATSTAGSTAGTTVSVAATEAWTGGMTAKPAVEPRFSAVRGVVVGGADGIGKKGNVLLCLRTGEAVEMEPGLPNGDRKKLVEGKKIDAYVFSSEPDYLVSLPTSDPCVVVGKDVDAGAWETMTPGELVAKIEALTHDPKAQVGTTSDNGKPVVFVFRSRELVMGIMRLMGKDGGGSHEVEIQMKVVER